jgi:hypothetical protein
VVEFISLSYLSLMKKEQLIENVLVIVFLILFNTNGYSQGAIPSLQHPIAAYHYSTPASQTRRLDHISVRFVNPASQPVANVLVKAEIREPSGQIVALTKTLDFVEAGADTLIQFPPYLPPAILGDFEVVFSNSIYTSSQDTVRREFRQSYHTYASNNNLIEPGGLGVSDSAFVAAGSSIQVGSIFFTGANPECWYPNVQFGISNIDEVYSGNPSFDVITVLLYDADPYDEGMIQLDSSWESLAFGIVGYGYYFLKGTELANWPVNAQVVDIHTDDPLEDLKPNHPYYISLLYDGLNAGLGKCIRFDMSSKEEYPDFPSTPFFAGQMMRNGWEEGTVMLEFNLSVFIDGTNTLLQSDKLSISPNPAREELQVMLNLDNPNPVVSVALTDWQGRTLQRQVIENFQEGQLSFNTGDLPSGVYLIQVYSAEGTTMRKLMVCH